MTSYLLSAFLLFQTSAAPALSVSGTWTLNGEVQGVAYTATCTFIQTGVTFSGDCRDDKAAHKTTGKIDGSTVTFTHDSDYNGDPITLNYSGKIDTGGKLTGAVEVEPYAVDGTFSAVRSTPQ